MNLILGVCGSVAAYRAADLARELMRSGFIVRVCLTPSASKFISPALFEALTGQPCLVDTFEEPERGRMAHIDWARWADAILIAPATANTINKLHWGIADGMLLTISLASDRHILVAPAMNPQMYSDKATQRSISALLDRGVEFIEPVEGDVACGENGQGKLAAISSIVEKTLEAVQTNHILKEHHVLITSGPTREPIDDVRYISNRSSGKMGAALAEVAIRMGAKVTVVSGPQVAPLPLGASVIRVNTAQEMLDACMQVPRPTMIIGAAAVADYHVKNRQSGKFRRSSDNLNLELSPNPDIIASLAKAHPSAICVGFAAEPSTDINIAKEKLARKGLFAVAANDISKQGQGFDSEANQLHLVFQDGGEDTSPLQSKFMCAKWLFEKVIARTK